MKKSKKKPCIWVVEIKRFKKWIPTNTVGFYKQEIKWVQEGLESVDLDAEFRIAKYIREK